MASVEKESAKSKKKIVDVTLNRKDSGSSSESANDAPEPAQEEGENKSENPTSKSSEQSDQNSLPAVQTHPRRSRDSRRHTRKRQVQFKLPTQRTVRRDRVDQQCRALNIKYRRWPGNREPKAFLHKSHCRFVDGTDGLPKNQKVPGDCIL
ncbi:MAG: hypothetical protein MJE68_29855, partial [Proteobacteria bacterium]|nr:hypothetical protein [Pseudomonadota bacterium]